jgi:hypothetical protein
MNWKKLVEQLKAWWKKQQPAPIKPDPVKPKPDPVTPPVPPSQFPTVRVTRLPWASRAGWNVPCLIPSPRGLLATRYNDNSREDSDVVAVTGGTWGDMPAGGWETLASAATAGGLSFVTPENGDGRVIVLDHVSGGWRKGVQRAEKICIAACVVQGRPVVFSWDQKGGSPSVAQWADTGERLAVLPVTGCVTAACEHDGGALCVIDGGNAGKTIVDTRGRLYPLAARSILRDGATVYAGGADGLVYELVGSRWQAHTTAAVQGRIMSMVSHAGFLWLTDERANVWMVNARGGVRQIRTGDGIKIGWFGPPLAVDGDSVVMAAKVPDGNSWRCVVERVSIL